MAIYQCSPAFLDGDSIEIDLDAGRSEDQVFTRVEQNGEWLDWGPAGFQPADVNHSPEDAMRRVLRAVAEEVGRDYDGEYEGDLAQEVEDAVAEMEQETTV